MLASVLKHTPSTSPLFRVRTCGKINLRLEVLGRRNDSYHEVRSLAAAVGVYDEISLQRIPAAGDEAFSFLCNDPSVPASDDNLVAQAARALAEHVHPSASRCVQARLHKRIPVAAGLGGGSSDAAATLWALNRLWDGGLGREELIRIGAGVGSDVPLFFCLPTVRMTGRGSEVAAVPLRWSGWAALVVGGWPVSTRQVYEAWTPADRMPSVGDELERMQVAGTAAELSKLCANDLEAAVFRICPPVKHLKDRVEKLIGHRTTVSGAGSTLFCLYDDPASAENVQRVLSREGTQALAATVGNNVVLDFPGENHGYI